MPVLINYKICDKGKGCPCIGECPQGAWSFDEEKGRPVIDNAKCNNCGICIKTCPARAVLFAVDEEGLKALKEEVNMDPRTEEDIFKLRYAADPIDQNASINAPDFEKEVLSYNGNVLVEFWSGKTCNRCRISSILYRDVLPRESAVKIVQVNADDEVNKAIVEQYADTLPCVVVFKKGDKAAAIIGCQTIADKDILKQKLKKAIIH